MAKQNIENKVEEDALFHRLPDHVLLYILSKVVDDKSLFRCLAVSKQFTSVLLRISTATLPIHSHRHVIATILNFIKRFNAIKSLTIESSYPNLCKTDRTEECLIKWKAEFGSKLNNFVILSTTSLHAIKNEEEEEEEVVKSAIRHIEVIIRRLCLFKHTIVHWCGHKHMIQNMVITDSERGGKIICDRQSFDRFKNSTFSTLRPLEWLYLDIRVPVYMKLWYVPLLRLSSSGYAMKHARLIMIRRCKSSDDDDDHDNNGDEDGILASAFQEEEEKVFKNAVTEILRNKNAIQTEQFLDWSKAWYSDLSL